MKKVLLGVALALAVVLCLPASPASADVGASITGSSVSATGWYYRGLHSRGAVTDTAADGHCAYADVKLALSGYNDIVKKKGNACGKGNVYRWDHTSFLADVGPILSSYGSGAIQGVYVRACIENRTYPLPDTCGGWQRIGGYGSSSAR